MGRCSDMTGHLDARTGLFYLDRLTDSLQRLFAGKFIKRNFPGGRTTAEMGVAAGKKGSVLIALAASLYIFLPLVESD